MIKKYFYLVRCNCYKVNYSWYIESGIILVKIEIMELLKNKDFVVVGNFDIFYIVLCKNVFNFLILFDFYKKIIFYICSFEVLKNIILLN